MQSKPTRQDPVVITVVFVGTRAPTGRLVAEVRTDGDDDDLFYDTARRRVYASCGQGFVGELQQADPDRYEPLAQVPTASGARTSSLATTRVAARSNRSS